MRCAILDVGQDGASSLTTSANRSSDKRAAPLIVFSVNIAKSMLCAMATLDALHKHWGANTLDKFDVWLKDPKRRDSMRQQKNRESRKRERMEQAEHVASTPSKLEYSVQAIFNACTRAIALAMSLAIPSRSCETALEASIFDLVCDVDGPPGQPPLRGVPLVALALMDSTKLATPDPDQQLPWLPRRFTAWYWKGKRVRKFIQLHQYTLPSSASALSLPHVVVWAMSIILRLRPDFLDPQVNKELRLCMCMNGQQLNPLTTSTFGQWLSAPTQLPPCICEGFNITPYSVRASFAISFVQHRLLERHNQMASRVREWFGHSQGSAQIEDYASTPFCCKVCVPQ